MAPTPETKNGAEGDVIELGLSDDANDFDPENSDSAEQNGVDDIVSLDDDPEDSIDFIPIQEQREIITNLEEDSVSKLVEGTALNVIFESWWNAFQTESIETVEDALSKIGPIDTAGILDAHGIFCDHNVYPLKVITKEVFSQIEQWYGLREGSNPVLTYAIDVDGKLLPELARPQFYLHHLSTDIPAYSTNDSCPAFAISRLHTLQDLLQFCVSVLDKREKISQSQDFQNMKFRIWVVQDNIVNSVPYWVTPQAFSQLENKILIKKDHLKFSLKSSNLIFAHIFIERYVPSKILKGSKGFWPSYYFLHHPPTPSDGRVGLQNLGNTCYMNSALQCLVHIPELTQYFLFHSFETELNTDNPLGMGGKIALAFSNLVHNLFDKKSNHGTSFTPREFKSTIGHFNQMFSGYHQQDSQEFLAFLLDGLHEDLNRIIKKPFVEKPELDEKDSSNTEAIQELAQKSWDHHKLRNDSIIIDLFVGLYKSTLVCPSCDKISITFDPFNDLTLPLPVENVWSGKLLLFLENGPIKSFEVELPKTSTYQTLKNYVADKLDLNSNHLITCEIWNNQFYRNFESNESQSSYLPISDLISDNDVIIMYEINSTEVDLVVPVINTVLPDSGIPTAFGFPFFISLSPEEQNSFGSIRAKLEHRYEQLSTYNYFSKTRAAQQKKEFESSDFDMSDLEDDSRSMISLANPEISGEHSFKVKFFDSSREIKHRKRFTQYGADTRDDTNLKVWTPSSGNNFKDLPELLDLIDPKKAAFYRAADKIKKEETNSEENNNDLEETDAKAPPPKDLEIVDLTNNSSNESETDDNTAEAFKSFVDIGRPKIPNILDGLDHELSVDGNIIPDPENDPNGDDDNILEKHKRLLELKNALICEWTSDDFDTFFTGLDDEDKCGSCTWSNPEVLVNSDVEESKQRRESAKSRNLTLDQCLNLFSKAEVLGEHDLWYCSNCKIHRQATKQIQIWSTPDILSIHLKRFENQRSFSDKIDAVVDFPIEGLDMCPYISNTVEDKDHYVYDLFAVDNHYGGLGGGHYTSYVKNFIDNKWYYYDDSRVSPSSPEKSITGAAYLLFYRRRSSQFLGGDELNEMLEKAREKHDQQEKEVLERLERFYHHNMDGESEEDENDEELEIGSSEVEELDSDIGVSPAKISKSDEQPDKIDNSIIDLSNDEDDDPSQARRKHRVLTRGGSSAKVPLPADVDVSKLQRRRVVPTTIITSDIDSPTCESSGSSPSDDCSTHSASTNPPLRARN